MSDKTIAARVADRFARANWDGKFVGKNARLQWSRAKFFLEELPQKGKKKLRQADIQNPYWAGHQGTDWWIPENLLHFAKLASSDDYDRIKDKIEKAYEEAKKRTAESTRPAEKDYYEKNKRWIDEIKWYEHLVFYLEVVPENVEPYTVEGKDFTVSVEWGTFKAYSPNSDFAQSDPHYTYYEASAPTAGRKLYKLLKEDPNALKAISWMDFGDWLTKNKIGYDTHHSVWH